MLKFEIFFEQFLDIWKRNSLSELEEVISKEYQAREVVKGKEIVDFGYEESINGWRQAFDHFRAEGIEWDFSKINFLHLRENEVMAVFRASFVNDGKHSETANLFFDTFQYVGDRWQLVRSYIEAGLPNQ